ncbi:MAG: gfo/Idh/MocA family oxidoreductase, partial [Sediminibacterium sp.]|nr:gfo/Idh/MocA family oxidoreductase [Sediminibacterium sp.]
MNICKCFSVCFLLFLSASGISQKPLRVAVAGISHGHSAFILGRKPANDITLVGVFETNTELANRYADKYHFSPSIIYDDLDKMLDIVKPEVVLAFGSIY